MNVKNKKGRANWRAGIALLLSILIMAAILTIMFVISDISVKEFQLSTVGKESQKAYYAAETGYECAKYWEDTLHAFSKTTGPRIPITCNGITFNAPTPYGNSTGFDRTVAQNYYNTDPPGPETHTPAIRLPNYNGLPVRVVVEPPGAGGPTVKISVTAENTTIGNTARKVQRTFEGLANACFANADVIILVDRSGHMCNSSNAREYILAPSSSRCPELDTTKSAVKSLVSALSPSTGPTGTHVGMLSIGYTVSYPGGPNVIHDDSDNAPPNNHTPVLGSTETEAHNASAPLGSDLAVLNNEIDQMEGGGKPNTPEAIARAVDEFNLRGRSGASRFIIIITNRTPVVFGWHDPTDLGDLDFSPTSYLCFYESSSPAGHPHDKSVGGNDYSGTTPPTPPVYPLSRAEVTKVANYAKGTGQCGSSPAVDVSAPVTIYAVGVSVDPQELDAAFTASMASPGAYYSAADFSELESVLVDQVATCQ